MLIELIATHYSPDHCGLFSAGETGYVRYLLKSLKDDSSDDSTKVLSYLLAQPKLKAWRCFILDALQTQKINQREAMFRHPDAFQVVETLNNRKPANVADLAALAVDSFQQLATEMHTVNTDSYKQFWNTDSTKNPVDPKHEEICRNYLVERLKPSLAKYEVSVELEAQQANEKRADLKLPFIHKGQQYYLPIEIKRDYHDKLWKTIHQQLIPLYTISPETEGRGIYLVLWFNVNKLKPSS